MEASARIDTPGKFYPQKFYFLSEFKFIVYYIILLLAVAKSGL